MSRSNDIIASLLGEQQVFPPPTQGYSSEAITDRSVADNLWQESVGDLERFWGDQAKRLLTWSQSWDEVLSEKTLTPDVKWFSGGKLNASYNCIDRHLHAGRGNKAAIIWQGEDDSDWRVYTYRMLHQEVCRFANILKKHGVGSGDRVAIYMPMIPELAFAMLACSRIGAMHSVVFAGFTARSLRNRIWDCEAKVVVTADVAIRAGKTIPIKNNVDEALRGLPDVASCIVVQRGDGNCHMEPNRDFWYHRELQCTDIGLFCEPVEMASNDPLFVMYTSGSTGKPKGVVHGTAGYLLYSMYTCKMVFDPGEDDIYWCTSDLGWVLGHSYMLYGPLGLGLTTVMFEGTPLYPGPDRFWQIIEKYRISIFYSSPTIIRTLMRYGNEPVEIHDISSLKTLGMVGEPINQEAWMWYYRVVGKTVLPIVDTWWQTETGGIMIAPLPYCTNLKPGAVTKPLPGIEAEVLDEEGNKTDLNRGGRLVIKKPWPGMLQSIFGDNERFRKDYFTMYENRYVTGDGARIDEDGYFWITGRLDDVINVSGHRIGTAEIESALVSHASVIEAAVVGVPHPVKGQSVYAYVALQEQVKQTSSLLRELKETVRSHIGAIAVPDIIQYTEELPKTRSGKVMRRVLRKIAADEGDVGDTSTIADLRIIDDLRKGKEQG